MTPMHRPSFFLLLAAAVMVDASVFFFAEHQATFFLLTLFSLQLFPLASWQRLLSLCSAVCLQNLLCFSALFAPLAYVLPSIATAHLLDGRLYHTPLLPIATLALGVATQTWLLEPYKLAFTPFLACTTSTIFGIIVGALVVSLTLRKQGGQGSRSQP